MVLEHLFPETWLEKKTYYAFIIAAIYSTIGIIASKLLFGANSGIVSVFFTSLLILPYLQKLFKKEQLQEEKEKTFSLKKLWQDNKTIIKVYFSIFFGIYFTYMLYSFLLPQIGMDTFGLFKEQLFLDPALRGRAFFDVGLLTSILSNNWWVLLACFLIALLVGDGAIFFITWNASSWGVLFGYRALSASVYSGESALIYLGLIILITLPHVLLEGAGYILAAISGSVISDGFDKKEELSRFISYTFTTLLLFFLLNHLFQMFFSKETIGLLWMIIITSSLFFLGKILEKKDKELFNYNYFLFVMAVIIFIIGAVVETIVLNSSNTLNQIYFFSSMI
jgi:MFS family permease